MVSQSMDAVMPGSYTDIPRRYHPVTTAFLAEKNCIASTARAAAKSWRSFPECMKSEVTAAARLSASSTYAWSLATSRPQQINTSFSAEVIATAADFACLEGQGSKPRRRPGRRGTHDGEPLVTERKVQLVGQRHRVQPAGLNPGQAAVQKPHLRHYAGWVQRDEQGVPRPRQPAWRAACQTGSIPRIPHHLRPMRLVTWG